MKTLRVTSIAEFGERAATVGRDILMAESPIHDRVEALAPEELACIEGASAQRLREYATGRSLARELLDALGRSAAVVPMGADRSPLWPAGFVGSIAHTDRRCVVVASRANAVCSLGVDIEPADPLERDVFESIATTRELGALAWTSAHDRGLDARRLFVAKEAVYKCLHPVARQFLEFPDVEITFDAGRRRFRARCERVGNVVRRLEGFVSTREHEIVAVTILPAWARVEAG